MNKRIGDFTARNLIIIYIILYTIMPIVARLTSRYLTTYFYMGLIVVFVLLVMVMDDAKNLNKYMSFLLPFIAFQMLSLFSPIGDVLLWGYGILAVLLPVIVGYYLTEDVKRIIKPYYTLLIISMIITIITTIIGCIQYPGASRIMATISSSQDANAIMYDMKNIGGYYVIYFMVLLYPVIILAYKIKKIKMFTAIAISVIILVMAVYSEYTTALVLFVLSSPMLFMKRDFSLRGVIIITIAGFLILFLFSGLITGFFDWLSKQVSSEDMADRLSALAGGVQGLENAEDNRIELYRMSLNKFLTHPLFGTLFESYKLNGGHSFILDNLASYGLIGGALMYFMYRRIFERFFLPFKDKPGFGYVIWTFIQAIILSIVNTGMWLEVLCLFCPILFYWIYETEPKTEEIENEDTLDSQPVSGSAG